MLTSDRRIRLILFDRFVRLIENTLYSGGLSVTKKLPNFKIQKCTPFYNLF